ncbi:MAG: carboxypeptidase regulatory-like domain-containing protein [Candidatus Eisenbacteria bacterium]|nr:carboxypeptidase regulatory-like domain-containing protein [Candidatus Eisenbacteria bacterium]
MRARRRFPIVLTWVLGLAVLHDPSAVTATTPAPEAAASRTVAVLAFEDQSGTGAPAALGEKIARMLQQQLAADPGLLPKVIAAAPGNAPAPDLTVIQLAALGRDHAAQALVRGGLLRAGAEASGSEVATTVELYADVLQVAGGSLATVRGAGSATERAAGGVRLWGAGDVRSAAFEQSAAGRALVAAVVDLAAAVQSALGAAQETEPAAAGPAEEVTGSAEGETPAGADESAQADAAEAAADDELQQLVAQAEEVLNSGAGSEQQAAALDQALQDLEAALQAKATALEKQEDAGAAVEQVATARAGLEAAVGAILDQDAAAGEVAGMGLAEMPASGAARADLLERANQLVDGTLGLLQKIQMLRAELSGSGGEQAQGAAEVAPYDESGYGAAAPGPAAGVESGGEPFAGVVPAEEESGEVEGVVEEQGQPVAGAVVTDEVTGESATTGPDGSYTLQGLLPGALARLRVVRGALRVGGGTVDVRAGRAAIADFALRVGRVGRPDSAGARARVMASAVAFAPALRDGGTLRGVVRDAQGHPLPHALVRLDGRVAARTDARGAYTFTRVPAGDHQLAVQRSGLKLRSQRVRVEAHRRNESLVRYAAADAAPRRMAHVVVRGAGTLLSGVIRDREGRALAAARVSAVPVAAAARAAAVRSRGDGRYSLRDLRPGNYRVLVTRTGYAPARQGIALRAGHPEKRDFRLEPSGSQLVRALTSTRRTSAARSGTATPRAGAVAARAAAGTAPAGTPRASGTSVTGAAGATRVTGTTASGVAGLSRATGTTASGVIGTPRAGGTSAGTAAATPHATGAASGSVLGTPRATAAGSGTTAATPRAAAASSGSVLGVPRASGSTSGSAPASGTSRSDRSVRAKTRQESATPERASAARGSLRVEVRDMLGRPVDGTVTVTRAGKRIASAATHGGRCSLTGLPAGRCDVSFSAPGGRRAQRGATVSTGREAHVELRLTQ